MIFCIEVINKISHPPLSFAVLAMLFQSNHAFFIPVSIVLLHLSFALPGFLLPGGDHLKDLQEMPSISCRSTWPKFYSWNQFFYWLLLTEYSRSYFKLNWIQNTFKCIIELDFLLFDTKLFIYIYVLKCERYEWRK